MSDFSIWGLGLAVVLLVAVHADHAVRWRSLKKKDAERERELADG